MTAAPRELRAGATRPRRRPLPLGDRRPLPLGDFHGRVLRGTEWFEHYYTGERVALLASGAEAAAILPELLHTASTVTVFEESPTWITPVPIPLVIGPLRRLGARAYLRVAIKDAWVRRNLTPHPRFGSRQVTVSPSYYAALQDPRTRLVHWPAYAIAERGVRGVDGVEYQVETIVIGATSRFAERKQKDSA